MENMGIKKVITAPQSPWQNPFVERLIGSVRRDCLDHVIVLNESHLSRILSSYFDYYHYDRTHYGLGKDTPVERPVQPRPDKDSKVIDCPGSADCIIGTNGKKQHREKPFCERPDLLGLSYFQFVPSIDLNWFIPREVSRITSGKAETTRR
jgi:hypothetical protein